MKLTLALSFIVCGSAGTSAFTPASKSSSPSTQYDTIASFNAVAIGQQLDNDSRPLYDPLGLYPEDSEERQNGRIKAIEPEVVVKKPILDPMGLYSKNDGETDSGVVMSTALPFATQPIELNGELAGDNGFDPLGFASSQEKLFQMREAEIKHSRLAMLAAAGWPLSELFDKKLASVLNLKPLLGFGDKVPSLLNGGLTKVSPVYWGLVLALASGVELYSQRRAFELQENPDYFPGNLKFDPFGLYPKEESKQKRMQLAEIKHGRLAMLAITGFAIQEAVTKIGVVNQTPFFFHPISEYFESLTNAGYLN